MAVDKRKRPERNQYMVDYKKEHYYRLSSLLPKEYKEIVQSRSESLGLSLTQYIKSLIDADCNITEGNVKTPDH